MVRPWREPKVERRRLGIDLHVDRLGRAPRHVARGVGDEQDRLVHVPHVASGEHRLVALDEDDLVRAGDDSMIYDDDFRPVDLGAEANGRDATAWGRAADRHPPERALERQVVDVALAAGELGEPFAAVHGSYCGGPPAKRQITESPTAPPGAADPGAVPRGSSRAANSGLREEGGLHTQPLGQTRTPFTTCGPARNEWRRGVSVSAIAWRRRNCRRCSAESCESVGTFCSSRQSR